MLCVWENVSSLHNRKTFHLFPAFRAGDPGWVFLVYSKYCKFAKMAKKQNVPPVN